MQAELERLRAENAQLKGKDKGGLTLYRAQLRQDQGRAANRTLRMCRLSNGTDRVELSVAPLFWRRRTGFPIAVYAVKG
jgi:hypothetical protein